MQVNYNNAYMIIICNDAGQMCNRVKEFAHCIATGLENKETIYNLKFLPYAHFFDFPKQNIKIGYLRNKFLYRALCSIDRRLRNAHILSDLDRNYLGIRFVNNPEFYNWPALFKYQKEIADFFTFKSEYVVAAEQKYASFYEEGYEIIVGVHVRRGDYKCWVDGKYFYEDEVYQKFMEEFITSTEKKVAFVVCTNDDKVSEKSFGDKVKVFLSNGNQAVDLIMLEKADYVMGPPSTFSWWAAYSGHKKYLSLVDENQTVKESCFSFVEENFDENGEYVLYKGFH